MSRSRRVSGCALGLLAATSTTGFGQTPPLVPIRGTLTRADGAPRSGVFPVRARLYDVAMGGTPIFEETQPEIAFGAAGGFSMFIGAVTPLPPDLFHNHPTLYLDLQIDGEPFLDRLLIGTVPFASHADHASIADRAIEADGLAEGALASGAVDADAIADGAIGEANLADEAVTSAKLADGTVGGADLATNLFTLEGPTNISRQNNAGTNQNDLGLAARRFCFLTRVELEDIDRNLERAECQVRVAGGRWVVEASLSYNEDAFAGCSAMCLTW